MSTENIESRVINFLQTLSDLISFSSKVSGTGIDIIHLCFVAGKRKKILPVTHSSLVQRIAYSR